MCVGDGMDKAFSYYALFILSTDFFPFSAPKTVD